MKIRIFLCLLFLFLGCEKQLFNISEKTHKKHDLLNDTTSNSLTAPIVKPKKQLVLLDNNFSHNNQRDSTVSIHFEKVVKKQKSSNNQNPELGVISYSIPDTMVLGNCYDIRIRIKQHSWKTINIQVGLKNPTTSSIKTSSKMEVSLIDPLPIQHKAFEIIKTNSDVQLIDSSDYTEWIYNVCAIRNGNFHMNLVVSIIKDGANKNFVYENNILIKNNEAVKIESIWNKNWQWIFSVVLFPVLAWGWKKSTEKKQKHNGI